MAIFGPLTIVNRQEARGARSLQHARPGGNRVDAGRRRRTGLTWAQRSRQSPRVSVIFSITAAKMDAGVEAVRNMIRSQCEAEGISGAIGISRSYDHDNFRSSVALTWIDEYERKEAAAREEAQRILNEKAVSAAGSRDVIDRR
jgi:hypothetical protein